MGTKEANPSTSRSLANLDSQDQQTTDAERLHNANTQGQANLEAQAEDLSNKRCRNDTQGLEGDIQGLITS